jgi:glycosyltransferase involved in cell wall biosynthesis
MAWQLSRGSERSLPYHLFYLAEAARLARWLKLARVTHLHAHFGTNSADVAVLAARIADCECSFTVHGPEEFDKPAAIHLGDKAKASKFVVAVSSFGRSQLFRWLNWADWGKVKVVHCGLDQHFLSEAPEPVPDVPHLVCVGRLCEQKGQYLLVKAARLLAREGVPFRLTLAGDGELRAGIEQYIEQESLQHHVDITGWLSGEQVKALLRQTRAMILPSFAEGLPVVIMEAMAMGRPVLSTYVAGIPELVLHGATGWLFPAGDVEQMAECMRECLQASAASLQAMGEEGRRRVLARHDVDRSAELLDRWMRHGAERERS